MTSQLLFATVLFIFVVMTERHKSIREKSGKTIVATLLLSLGVVAEMKNLTGLSQQLSQYNIDKLGIFIKDIAFSLGFSSSAVSSFYFVAFSVLAMFVLIFNQNKPSLALSYDESSFVKQQKNTHKQDACTVKALRQPCICAKMLN